MYYILCEDSGSGFQFYKKLASLLCKKEDYIVLTSYGNSKYRGCLLDLVDKLNEWDTLILAFDCVGQTSTFNAVDILDLAKDAEVVKGFNLYYTDYYCFEELFLSYKYLVAMFERGSYADSDKFMWVKLLNYLYNEINNGHDYYLDSELVEYVKSNIGKACKTREKFAKVVLRHISGSIYGDFKISDGHFGKCWLGDCDIIKFKNKEYNCKKCYCKCRLGVDKLCMLESNSIGSDSLSYLDVFK